MWTLAFYLAMLAFFLPKKAKKVVAYISMGLTAFHFILFVLGCLFGFYIYGIGYLFSFGTELNPFYWLFRFVWRFVDNIEFYFVWLFVHNIEINILRTILAIFVNMIEDGLQILLAFLALKYSFINLKYSFIKYKKDELEKTEKEQTESSPTEIQTSSYFDGGLIQYIGWTLLGALVTFITLGICFPCAYVMIFKWEAKHTVINGQRLKFDGKAIQLLGNWILWLILTVITFGIFSFWIPIKLTKWKTKHTSFIE
jgi:hypothetical protein